MVIAIDYDDTISINNEMWVEIINVFQSYGHKVVCVTYRQPDCDPHELEWLEQHDVEVFFTSQTSKSEFMERCGLEIGIWIDDDPLCVSHSFLPKEGYVCRDERTFYKVKNFLT